MSLPLNVSSAFTILLECLLCCVPNLDFTKLCAPKANRSGVLFGRRGQPSPKAMADRSQIIQSRVFVEVITLAGAVGIEPTTSGFGDLRSTN